MSTQGFPDWQENVPALGATPVSLTAVISTGVDTYGPYYVGGYEDVYFYFKPVSALGGNLITLQWFDDLAGTKQVGIAQVETYGVQFVRQRFANLGPYVQVTVQPQGAALGTAYAIALQPRRAINGYDPSMASLAWSYISASYVGGGGGTQKLLYVAARNVQLTLKTNATLWSVMLESLSSAGSIAGIPFWADQTSAAGGNIWNVSLPSQAHQVTILNNDGVLRNFDLTILPNF